MAIRVLIVDDSRFFCNRIKEILQEEYDFEVVGVAANGKQALILATQLLPDVITMDVEMPIMDGITAVKKIMEKCPTAILMFSSSTHAGAHATLEALEAGAIDFLPKQLDIIDSNTSIAKQLLRSKLKIVALQTKRIKRLNDKSGLKNSHSQPRGVGTSYIKPAKQLHVQSMRRNIELLVIVASTGGPVAIQKVLAQLPSTCSFPIVIVQHMPHNFTKSFAERLNQVCEISVKEAENNDILSAGNAYLGPGGMQMEIKKTANKKIIAIREKQKNDIYAPCADITLDSISRLGAVNQILTVILTGMGSDGKEGVKKIKQKKSFVWAQDEASCTIYGMPKAVVDAQLADEVLSLNEIANEFRKLR